MSKSVLYVAARSGSRASKQTYATALGLFISTGRFAGSPELAADIANYGLGKRWAIGLLVDGPCVVVTRIGF
jgi:hypothetical protein